MVPSALVQQAHIVHCVGVQSYKKNREKAFDCAYGCTHNDPVAVRKIRSVSLPPDLDARLDRFPQENWSAVAVAAFERRVRTLELLESSDADDRIAARLEASKTEYEDVRCAEAFEAGVRFTRDTAAFCQLERLAVWAEKRREERRAATSLTHLQSMRIPGFLAIARILAGNDEGAKAIDSQFRREFRDEVDSRQWMDAFVHGVIQEFKRLEMKIPVTIRVGMEEI